jgi:GH25 family lysozyme M1 (1,4-beta-N-acetylmuramidase)
MDRAVSGHLRARRLGVVLVLVALGTVAADARAATAPTGIDVSHWQGQIGWVQVAGAAYDFAFAKATEGTTFTDATYPVNRSGAGAAGMRIGAYHFARPTGSSDAAVAASAIAQADAFVAFAQPRRGDLLPVLDLEKNGGLSATRLTAWTQAWLGEVFARLGVNPIIYASPSFWKTSAGDTPVFALAGNRLWIAHWTKAGLPTLPGAGWGGLGWTFWQWTDCSKVPGIVGCVDGDRLNGTNVAAATMPAYPGGPPVSSSPPSIVGTPQAGKLLAAIPGGWGGGKPVSFAYQWQSCDAAGAGCTPITGAAKQSYTPKAADVGHALVVSITAQAAGGTAVAISPPTLAVASSGTAGATAPKATTLPAIQGTAQTGQTLSALTGTWTGSPTGFSYQWRRCTATGAACTAIASAAATSYTLTPDDIGAMLLVVVTATGKGGSASASTAPTPVVVPAPLPTPTIGLAVAQPGQAGAVTNADRAVTATWQPGAVPAQATVGLGASASRLALPRTAFVLRVSAAVPLAWPIDLQYADAPADVVPGFLAGKGTWQPVAQLPSSTLPTGQMLGAYRDNAGALHVLTRMPGRLALFAPGKWGDPRYVSGGRPRLTLVTGLVRAKRAGGAVLLQGRITLDSQAHLSVSLVARGGGKALLVRQGSRLGGWLEGGPTRILKTLQLRPGALPLRVRVAPRQLDKGRYELQITVVDPYRRRAKLVVPLSPPR